MVASLVVEHGPESVGSVVVAHGLRCPETYGIFPDQGSNLCSLHQQADLNRWTPREVLKGDCVQQVRATIYHHSCGQIPSGPFHVLFHARCPQMEALISHFAIKKRFREVKSRRSQSSCTPGSKIDARNRYTCHIASHCTPKQRGFICLSYQALFKHGRLLSISRNHDCFTLVP